MLDLKEAGDTAKKWFSGDKKIKLVVALGLAGMLLILLSQFWPGKKAEPDNTALGESQFTSAEYAAELETRLTDLLCGMSGVGETKVFITLEDSGETVYAQEEKRNTDKQQETGAAEASGKITQRENVEQKYIIVDGSTGKEALIKSQLQPKIQGVVVVCEGAGNPVTEQSIIHVVTTALNIPTTRVCVVKISK